MVSASKLILIALLLLAPLAAFGDDQPAMQAAQLPSLSDQPQQTLSSNQQFSVECYLGNPADKQMLGSLMANSAQQAGPACNGMYYSCKGACYGCFSDFDYSDDICVDNHGKKYLR